MVWIGLAAAALLIWVGIALHPARPWDFQPVAEDAPPPQDFDASRVWPPVRILVPARNEAESLPETLPALLAQDYPGSFQVILVDDRSDDGTAEVARGLASAGGFEDRLRVVEGAPLPFGWVGKMWALEQGAQVAFAAVARPDEVDGATGDVAVKTAGFVLLTDADICHAPGSLTRLVEESLEDRLGLNSRMARLRADSFWET